MARVAIVGTPRSGNMWLRRLLATATSCPELSADTPGAIDWGDLPDRAVLQLHWPPQEQLLGHLELDDFMTVALSRHPLDVLISILQFAQSEPRTARWLNGAGGNELSLLGADPTSEAFVEYALSGRARRLLDLTPSWQTSGRLSTFVRYEDLVASPAQELEGILATLAIEPSLPIDEILHRNTLANLRAETSSRHFWRGEPGHWRALLPADVASQIAGAHTESFAAGGYEADADPDLDADTARERWHDLLATSAQTRRSSAPSEHRVELHAAAHGPADDVVARLFELVLRRPADEASAADAADRLREGTLSPAALLTDLVTSTEGRVARIVDDTLAFAHRSRTHNERPRAIKAPRDMPEWAIGATWALARVPPDLDILDVGTAYAAEAYAAAVQRLAARRLVLVDAATTGLPVVEGDVRALPFAPASFDVILCLNTLHHVGADNRAFDLPAEHKPASQVTALASLRQTVRPDGRVFIAVPCGAPADLGMMTIRSAEEWLALFEQAGFFVFEQEVYELTAEGWLSHDAPYPSPEYGQRGPGASALLQAELRPGRLRQTARRALGRAARSLGY